MNKKHDFKHREIILTKSDGILDAKRYLANAKESLARSPMSESGKLYEDAKYVRQGSGIAYLAALKAIDAYLVGKGIENAYLPRSIEEYWKTIKKIPHNGKLKEALTIAYQNLHIYGYYGGGISASIIKEGLMATKEIIDMLEN